MTSFPLAINQKLKNTFYRSWLFYCLHSLLFMLIVYSVLTTIISTLNSKGTLLYSVVV